MDTSELFAMIFGSDKFEPLVGELLLASAMEEGLEPEDIIASSLGGVTAKQRKREAQCALNLAEKLAPLLVGVGLSRTESGPGGGQRSSKSEDLLHEREGLSPMPAPMPLDEFLVKEHEDAQVTPPTVHAAHSAVWLLH